MAQKKITDLQLIDSVTSGLSVPADDGIQSYRFTAAQMKSFILANENILLAMLKTDIFNGLSAVTPADDDYLILNDTSDSNKMKKGLVSNFVRNAVRSVSSYPATVTSADTTLKLSSTSGTITLPTAVGLDGKRFKFVHAGTNFTQIYTIGTTSGQTIGTVAGGSYKLHTNGEVLEVESDGANWMIVGRVTDTDWIDCGAMTIEVVTLGTNPTKATTKIIDKVYLKRSGRHADLRYRYAHSNNSGAASGSGKYKWLLPVTADTTYHPVSTVTDFGSGADVVNQIKSRIGGGMTGIAAGSNGPTSNICLYDSTHFTAWNMQISGGEEQIDHDYFDLGKSTLAYAFDINGLAVADWQP